MNTRTLVDEATARSAVSTGHCTFAPPLDDAGNSIKGQFVTKFLSEQLGLNLFASQPAN